MGLKTCGCCSEESVCTDKFVLNHSCMTATAENAENPNASETQVDWPTGTGNQITIENDGELVGFSTRSIWWQYLATVPIGLGAGGQNDDNRDFVEHTHVQFTSDLTFELDVRAVRFFSAGPFGPVNNPKASGVHASYDYNCINLNTFTAPLLPFSIDAMQATLAGSNVSDVVTTFPSGRAEVQTSISSLSELIGNTVGARIWFTCPTQTIPPHRKYFYNHDRETCHVPDFGQSDYQEYDYRFIIHRSPLTMRGLRYLPWLTGNEIWTLDLPPHSQWPRQIEMPVNFGNQKTDSYQYDQVNLCSAAWRPFSIMRAAVVWGTLFPHVVLTRGPRWQFYKPEEPWAGRGTAKFVPDGDFDVITSAGDSRTDEIGLVEGNFRLYGQHNHPAQFPHEVVLTLTRN